MAEPIPLLDLKAQNGPLEPAVLEAITRVVESQRFIMGPEVEGFEREVAEATGFGHAVGVSSGTDALILALMALGVGPGDEVITTPFSFFATAGCIRRVGATPVFVDIDPVSFNLNPARLEDAITERTRAVLPVHLFGQPAEIADICDIAERRGLPVIEDAAQALGARCGERPVGTFGAFGCFSFFPSKNLGAFGDAGLVTSEDAELAERARVLRVHGGKPKYYHARIGGNFRLDALQAAVLRVKLPHLEAWTRARRENAADYDARFAAAGLEPELLSTPRRIHVGHVYNQYVIRTPKRDAVRDALKAAQIGCEIYYPLGLHAQACFADLGYAPGSMPETERAADEVLALPIYAELTAAQRERVVDTVLSALRS